MTADDPRRELLIKLGFHEKETTIKMNRDFTTFPETFIANGDIKCLQVYSEEIQKVENT
jgi:hypothetical protein